jgi:cytochrome b subunit of formate dehydrogenase
MELFRTAADPEGRTILLGIGGDLVWLVVAATAVLVLAHLVWVRALRAMENGRGVRGGPDSSTASTPAGVPRRVLRHTATARGLHWTMSLTTLALLITGFAPASGLAASWTTVHWCAGLGLVLAVAWHVIHALGWQDFWSMWIGHRDVHDGMIALRHALSASWFPATAGKLSKYRWTQKLHHNLVAMTATVAMATGSLMLARIDTPWWSGRPSLLHPAAWGWVRLAHGLAGVGLVGLIGVHAYLALRPERRWLTWSMVRGWIPRERYLANHDPRRWPPRPASPPPPPSGSALSDAGPRASRGDV